MLIVFIFSPVVPGPTFESVRCMLMNFWALDFFGVCGDRCDLLRILIIVYIERPETGCDNNSLFDSRYICEDLYFAAVGFAGHNLYTRERRENQELEPSSPTLMVTDGGGRDI